MAKKQLLKELEKQDPEELLRLLGEVARRFPVAKMYLTMEFGFENQAILDKYKKDIRKEYFPTRGRGKARSSKVNRILKEFGLVAAFMEDLVEMYWFQIENALRYHQLYHHDYEPFLVNLIKNWRLFLKMARAQGLMETYQPKIDAAFSDSFKKFALFRELRSIMEDPEEEPEEEISEE
jgi:hypothetical protein